MQVNCCKWVIACCRQIHTLHTESHTWKNIKTQYKLMYLCPVIWNQFRPHIKFLINIIFPADFPVSCSTWRIFRAVYNYLTKEPLKREMRMTSHSTYVSRLHYQDAYTYSERRHLDIKNWRLRINWVGEGRGSISPTWFISILSPG